MEATQYISNILQRERSNPQLVNDAEGIRLAFYLIVSRWKGTQLRSVKFSGSYTKGTSNNCSTDLDLFISLQNQAGETLKDVYLSLEAFLKQEGFSAKRQRTSLGLSILYSDHSYDIDLVPAQVQPNYSDHSINMYTKPDNWTWRKTNIEAQIAYVKNSGRQECIRAIKLWKHQKQLEFPSFLIELMVIEALMSSFGQNLATQVVTSLQFIRDHIEQGSFKDPGNSSNNIADTLTPLEKRTIKLSAINALAGAWEGFVI